MYINRSSLDSRFNSHLKFLEKKYNIMFIFEYVGENFTANIFNADNLEELEAVVIGTRDDTKERLYVNLARHLRDSGYNSFN